MRGGVASSRRAIAAERREAAWKLRKRGYSFQDIADELGPAYGGYSKSSAERDVKRILNELNERTLETAAEARALDLARLDELLSAWFTTALRQHERAAAPAGEATVEGDETGEGDETETIDWSRLDPLEALEAALKEAMLSKQAADVIFKVLEQRAKLMGLYRQEVALTTPVPLQVAADLSGLNEESLDAIIRNLTAALSTGDH